MTDKIMNLRALREKSSDADLLREMIGFAARRLMDLEVEGLTGAAHGERSPERLNQRNAIATGYGRRAPERWNLASPIITTASLLLHHASERDPFFLPAGPAAFLKLTRSLLSIAPPHAFRATTSFAWNGYRYCRRS
jgi:Transposase, Mutator family